MTLSELINVKCQERGISGPTELQALLEKERGITFTRQAVSAWMNGGGIRKAHMPHLAAVLGLSLAEIITADLARPSMTTAAAG